MTITDILPRLSWEPSAQLVLIEGSIENRTMQYLLDTIPSNVGLYVFSDVESSFNHEKALSFPYILYNEARWIKIDNLISMRNCKDVKLNRTNFTCEDIRKLIDYWTDCEEDMFWKLTIKLENNVTHDMNTIIQGMKTRRFTNSPNFYCFVARNPEKKRSLACIEWKIDIVTLQTWEPIGPQLAEVHSELQMYERGNQLYTKLCKLREIDEKDQEEWKKADVIEKSRLANVIRSNRIQLKQVQLEYDEICVRIGQLSLRN
ncbi:hypothetical protein CRE_24956 [Caenorhabditis remanei]|uniref:F-box associated domain-containing protein n=1 Tax=Caenorhabditis remanei TaxID=31234 RepID=E3MI01_CAERE|nr:hypothetical protein CRE_24956 [Caenorhabditis remanei]